VPVGQHIILAVQLDHDAGSGLFDLISLELPGRLAFLRLDMHNRGTDKLYHGFQDIATTLKVGNLFS
jgi:hypothetical protein